ncbi:PROTEIN ASPARTIC PROTEASE IN GUARD CELL 2 [Salix viminalis]|uniref:PROTEIN ASPARTIC PROTEASE IN GUARD CELL 2 n=1 Tax=Salix viminalis TaxID=40686 RepID=A0A9Q0UX25_SALVM|nr:PROTEIN ASPARTIC PROTEASE IN GUARD CELL 2 [Salix viminalis]
MQRDVKRVASLIRRVSSGSAAASHEVEDFGSEVVSGTNQGSGEYFVRIGVGSPPRSQYMVIDSGSDIVENAGCNSGRRCRYEVSYGDGSSTKGTIALETLTLGRTVVENVAIGCGHMNQGNVCWCCRVTGSRRRIHVFCGSTE